jgi:hypothetical protein
MKLWLKSMDDPSVSLLKSYHKQKSWATNPRNLVNSWLENLFPIPIHFGAKAIFQAGFGFVAQVSARFFNINTGAKLIARALGHEFHVGFLPHDLFDDADVFTGRHFPVRTDIENLVVPQKMMDKSNRFKPSGFSSVQSVFSQFGGRVGFISPIFQFIDNLL